MIYHITTKELWEQALDENFYEATSLASEGFIHASHENQVKEVLNRYFQHQTDLILLHIDEDKVTAEIKYGLSPSVNELFPHIYGLLNIDAVIQISKIN